MSACLYGEVVERSYSTTLERGMQEMSYCTNTLESVNLLKCKHTLPLWVVSGLGKGGM